MWVAHSLCNYVTHTETWANHVPESLYKMQIITFICTSTFVEVYNGEMDNIDNSSREISKQRTFCELAHFQNEKLLLILSALLVKRTLALPYFLFVDFQSAEKIRSPRTCCAVKVTLDEKIFFLNSVHALDALILSLLRPFGFECVRHT